MRRNIWSVISSYYNEKVGCTLEIDVFKKVTQKEAEKEMKQEENGLYINLEKKCLYRIKEFLEIEISDLKRLSTSEAERLLENHKKIYLNFSSLTDIIEV
ncbi:hypothetical protein CWI36_0711p0010 [Hamiltosporidium magnivora]|uniref:Uncharacterized protein n=1 Tax=Hamiltosporidium magnivora TaxID=148818 RepID=A0A4Q9LDH0_9MICR|nr:hypothetical protein CWI36_0711p0010 [Hamiltosporidium magnivora]